ncbi:MAG: Rrf2 family transcriptional regulator [Peptococcaceae bacterium]|nr:MAG: Rrf2 family transcriptional regulator [Peptococcaceae bacterium]
MRLNQATDYAFRAVLHLSCLPRGQVVEARLIAEEQKIPMRFLLKILRLLTMAGIVESHRGVNGGFVLARAPAEITMLDVVEAIEGPIKINRCLIAPAECSRRAVRHCPVHKTLFSIQQALADEFKKHNFQELCGNVK